MTICPKCGKENPIGAQFCMHCGTNILDSSLETGTSSGAVCPKCGKENLEEARFCVYCGADITAPIPGKLSIFEAEGVLTAIAVVLTASAIEWFIVLFVLFFLIGLSGAASQLLGELGLPQQNLQGSGLVMFILTLLSFAGFVTSGTAAVGLFRFRRWAVIWTIVAEALSIILTFIELFQPLTVPPIIVIFWGMVLPVAIIFYVVQPNVRALLR